MSKTAFVMVWEESERGWGVRPDGHSIHRTKADYDTYLKGYWDSMPSAIQDEYSRPGSRELQVYEVLDEVLWEKLEAERSLRFFNSGIYLRELPNGLRQISGEPFDKVPSFVEQCLAGKVKPDDIDDFVENWHQGVAKGVTLGEYLGIPKKDYADWMKNANVIYRVLFDAIRAKNPKPEYYRHTKTQGVYMLHFKATRESNLESVAIYQGLDGRIWDRNDPEFEDGRFVPLNVE